MAVVQPDAGVVGHQRRGPHDRRDELEAVQVAAALLQGVAVEVRRMHVYLVALLTQLNVSTVLRAKGAKV